MNLLPASDSSYLTVLGNLNIALLARFHMVGSFVDLQRAIDGHWASLGLSPANHPAQHFSISGLVTALQERYRCTGSVGDLISAIRFQEDLIDLKEVPAEYRSKHLRDLSNSFRMLFDHTNSLEYIDKAIIALYLSTIRQACDCPA